ncbi:MAG: type I methionyl aminopeptidase [bacterium]|nr:type I methionyl aminopeptidase [bacterium]
MVTIKTPQEIKILKEGGKRLASVLNELAHAVRPGISAKELDDKARELIKKNGGEPAFLGYRPRGAIILYPAALCVSINDEVVHGIPSENKILREGDIASLDLGLKYKNLFTDMAVTVGVGKISAVAQKLINTAKESLFEGIKSIKEGATIGDYGWTVQNFAGKNGFSVVKELVGHGVGYTPHEDPDIPNWGKKGVGLKLKKGMVLALEPMVCQGRPEVILAQDNWTWKTKDGLLASHFECTITVDKEVVNLNE